MTRPVKIRTPSEQLTVLSRMLQQVQMDERIGSRRKKRLATQITELMAEFQKEVHSGAYTNGAES